MSDTSDDESEEPGPFQEGNHETRMAIDHARMPWYLWAAWVAMFIGYVAYFYTYGVPDLTTWGAP